METVALGLSGGVDSAEAAQRLMAQGYRVEGVWLNLGFGDREPARAAAEQLGIGFTVFDAAEAHEALVRQPFAEAYRRGLTPNPCASCNPLVKLPSLLRAAEALGAAWIATGHYGAVEQRPERALLRASGGKKDQSYMLALLPQQLLRRLLLPLSGLEKPAVRALAESAGLEAAGAKDSQDICFIPDGDYGAWLERRGMGLPEGDFVSMDGQVLGRHRGVHRYTIGQRRGLGVSAATRLYVRELRHECAQVVLCREQELLVSEIAAQNINWVSVPEQTAPFTAELKVRSGPARTPAEMIPQKDGSLRIQLETPIRLPAPGQLAVGYAGDLLLFGGVIQ